MAPLRVLTLTAGHEIGGAEIAAARLSDALQERGVVVKFVTADWAEGLPAVSVPHEVIPELSPQRKARMPIGLVRLAAIAREFQPDIIHSHHRWMTVHAMLVRYRSRRVVWHCHWQAPPSRVNGIADHVIAVSGQVAQHLSQQRHVSPVTTILNAPPSFEPKASSIEISDPNAFLYAGRLAEGKGVEHAIAAIARVPEASMVVAGVGPLRYELEQLADRLGCSERVTFLGWVSDPLHLPPQRVIFPSDSFPEGLPLVVLEAMSAGKLLIATRSGGVAEVIDGDCAILVEPGRDDELERAIEWTLRHPHEADALGRSAQLRAENYGTSAWAEAVETCFEGVRAGGPAARGIPTHEAHWSGAVDGDKAG